MRFLFTPWGLILQGLALIHFIRRRPDMYWLWIIIFLGPLGAGVYILMEVIPDLGVLRQSFDAFPRRKRIRQLEALVLDNLKAENSLKLLQAVIDSHRSLHNSADFKVVQFGDHEFSIVGTRAAD